MSILAECPICHKKQSNKNKVCTCGGNLVQAKKSNKVRYWISYRTDGKLKKRSLAKLGLNPYSIEDARDADAKRRTDKRENRTIFNEHPETKITFNDLSKWYLNLESAKILASYDIIKMKLNKFNEIYGNRIIADIILEDLKDYQIMRQKQGKAPGTVDHDIGKVKAMIYKAFDNGKVSGQILGTFKKVKKTMKKGSDVRNRILSPDEFDALMEHAKGHTRQIIAMGYYTGMRKGEILALTWNKVDMQNRLIKLEEEDTKDKEARKIPICRELYKMLQSMPNRLKEYDKDNHVFQFNGKPIKDIRNGLRKACKAAGISYGRFKEGGLIFHDLRHTFNTYMRKAGVSESVIMEITGHSTREMFDRYNTVDEDDTKKAIEKLESFLQVLPKTLPKLDIEASTKNQNTQQTHVNQSL